MKRIKLITLWLLCAASAACHTSYAADDTTRAAELSAAPTSSAAPWWRSAVVYEVFIRSFQDTDGDGVGDLAGVTKRLDYLKALGVDGLWLMPVFPSPSYHGYDVTDYQGINAAYGTMKAFKTLVSEAHRRGIRLILDIPLNHSSNQHPWFTAGLQNPSSPQRRRYVWRDQIPNWSALPDNATHWHKVGAQYYYGFFTPKMPDLNWTDADVYHDLAATLQGWTALGVDGFRLDAARYLAEGPHGESDTAQTHQLWQRLIKDVKAKAPQTLFVGEVWADQKTINTYEGGGKELDQAFAFPLAGSLVSALQSGNPSGFVSSLKQETAPGSPAFFSSPFLTNHDQVRLATTLGNDLAKLKLGATALMMLPGTPYLYYGEELGLPNGTLASQVGDLAKRTPMPWTSQVQDSERGFSTVTPWLPFATNADGIDVASQTNRAGSLLETYRGLIALRHREVALTDGTTSVLSSPVSTVVAFTRRHGSDTILVVLNFGGASGKALTLVVPWLGSKVVAATLSGGLTATVKIDGQNVEATLPPLAARQALVVSLTP